MTQWLLQYGKRVPLWDAVYAQDVVAVQKLLESTSGVEQVNIPHGVQYRVFTNIAPSWYSVLTWKRFS